LAGQQRFGIEIQLVVEGTLTIHDGIEMLAIHEAPRCATIDHVVERILSSDALWIV
jgi:hypothetical protein